MNKIVGCLFLLLVGLQYSCSPNQEIHFYLSEEQLLFINSAHPHDTCIWKSSEGLSDTLIQQPVVYNEYTISRPLSGDGTEIGQYGSYSYKIVGTNKLNSIIPEISVYSDAINNSLLNTVRCNGHIATGIFKNRMFGNVNYQMVAFWALANGTDTIFWNKKGFLGYVESGVRVEKIK